MTADLVELSHIRAEAGRRGGRALLNRYGIEHMKKMGRLGGRPCNSTLAEVKEELSEQRRREIERRRESLPGGSSLKALKARWELGKLEAGQA